MPLRCIEPRLGPRWLSILVLVLMPASLAACADAGGRDEDGDGVPLPLDCDDSWRRVHPGAWEVPYNGVDEDCNSATRDDDLDGDGYLEAIDCDDGDAGVHPGAVEVSYSGVDEDCTANTPDDDLDGDGHVLASDCDDTNALIHPSRPELPYNDTDDDCSLLTPDDDVDGDGYLLAGDCNDHDPAIHPGATEVAYNGKNDDCDATTRDDDLDADGYLLANDCNDGDAAIHPGATEVPYNGVNEDCSVATRDNDLDADGALLADDCDDDDPARSPLLSEVYYNGIDDDCDVLSPDDDVDGDGFLLAAECDDGDADVHPGAAEVAYNGKDDDCDPGTLEDDLDQDGALLASDCDDGDPGRSPLLVEVHYNGVDDDCSGDTWDDDVDQDGFLVAADCDDFDPLVSPSDPEVPHNEQDDDCNPVTPDDDVDGDGYLVAEDCDDFDADVRPDATEVCGDGIENDCNSAIDVCSITGDHAMAEAAASVTGVGIGGDYSGYRVSSSGDINGDGYDDLLIAAPSNDGVTSDLGAVYLFYGGEGAAALSGALSVTDADAKFAGVGMTPELGYGIDIAGDLDGDGFDDIVMGAPYAPDTATERGAVYIYYGGTGGNLLAGSYFVSSANATIQGVANFDRLGFGVGGAGDVNADGYDDLLVGAIGTDTGFVEAGTAYLFHGGSGVNRLSGTFSASTADFRTYGEGMYDHVGWSVSGAGDVDGNGYDDILIGAYTARRAHGAGSGAVYLFYSGSGAGALSGSRSVATAHVIIVSEAQADQLGCDVASAGDVDGDGYGDFILGAPYADTTAAADGAAYVFYGRPMATRLMGEVPAASADLRIGGVGESERAGFAVASGDVNGDGFSDLLVGAPYQKPDAMTPTGGANLVYGGPTRRTGTLLVSSADATYYGAALTDFAGASVSIAGDLDGDGYADIVIGAYGGDNAYGNVGRTYVFYATGI